MSVSSGHPGRHERREGRAGDEVAVQVIARVGEFTAFARGSDSIPRPAEEHSNLPHTKWPRAVLEHLWNTNVVLGW